MKYQLVLQFPEEELSFDELVQLEDSLINKLHGMAIVDGHDIGGGQINLFILTDFPANVFDSIKELLSDRYEAFVRVAYREITGVEYIMIWPYGLNTFCVA